MNVKSCSHLIFVASPFHAWMAKEYLHANGLTDYQIILWLHDQHTHYAKAQLNNTIDYLNLRNIITFEFPSSTLKRLIFERQFIQHLKQKNFQNILFFDFRNLFLHSIRRIFKKTNFILIDDGFSTVIAWSKSLNSYQYLPKPQSFYHKIIFSYYFTTEKGWLNAKSFKIFTIFSDYVKGNEVSENNLMYVRNRRLRADTDERFNNCVLVLGTRLVRRGLMEETDEMKILSQLELYWQSTGKRLVYVAKRSSNNDDLDRVASLGISIFQPELPIELELCSGGYLPHAICSFGSTAMRSIRLLFPEVPVYYIKSETISKRRDETIQAFENYYQSVAKDELRVIHVG